MAISSTLSGLSGLLQSGPNYNLNPDPSTFNPYDLSTMAGGQNGANYTNAAGTAGAGSYNPQKIVDEITASGLLPAGWRGGDNEREPTLQDIYNYALQDAGLTRDDYSDDQIKQLVQSSTSPLLQALSKAGIVTRNDATGNTLTLGDKSYTVGGSGANPSMYRNVPGYGTLYDSEAYNNANKSAGGFGFGDDAAVFGVAAAPFLAAGLSGLAGGAGAGAVDYGSGAGLESLIGGAGSSAVPAAAGAVDYGSGAGLESLIGGGGAPAGAGTTFGSVAPAAGAGTGAGAQTLAELGNLPATTWGAGAAAAGAGLTAAEAAQLAGAGGSAASTLSNILANGGSVDDWLKVAGAAVPAIGTYLTGDKQADALTGIYNQQRADRAPALAAYNNALANPNEFYNSAPAMGSVDAILRKLSTQGNPAANPGLLSQAASYNLGGYNNYLSGLAGPAFGGQATQANLATTGAQADANKYAGLGYGLGNLLNPQQTPNYKLTVGGV